MNETLKDKVSSVPKGRRASRFRQQVWAAQDQERKRIAYELHDSLAQKLTMMGYRLEQIEKGSWAAPEIRQEHVQQLRSSLESVHEEVRHLSHRLHPAVLDHLGLSRALANLCDEFAQTTSFPVVYVQDPQDPIDVPGPVAHPLYRIAQEAIQNAIRHAQPTKIWVTLQVDAMKVSISISDDGHGFDATKRAPGLGLTSMRDRVKWVGGQFTISSSSKGTNLHISVPLLATREKTLHQIDLSKMEERSPSLKAVRFPLLKGVLETTTDLIAAIDSSYQVIGFNESRKSLRADVALSHSAGNAPDRLVSARS